jgi:hypothetical protein
MKCDSVPQTVVQVAECPSCSLRCCDRHLVSRAGYAVCLILNAAGQMTICNDATLMYVCMCIVLAAKCRQIRLH